MCVPVRILVFIISMFPILLRTTLLVRCSLQGRYQNRVLPETDILSDHLVSQLSGTIEKGR